MVIHPAPSILGGGTTPPPPHSSVSLCQNINLQTMNDYHFVILKALMKCKTQCWYVFTISLYGPSLYKVAIKDQKTTKASLDLHLVD